MLILCDSLHEFKLFLVVLWLFEGCLKNVRFICFLCVLWFCCIVWSGLGWFILGCFQLVCVASDQFKVFWFSSCFEMFYVVLVGFMSFRRFSNVSGLFKLLTFLRLSFWLVHLVESDSDSCKLVDWIASICVSCLGRFNFFTCLNCFMIVLCFFAWFYVVWDWFRCVCFCSIC